MNPNFGTFGGMGGPPQAPVQGPNIQQQIQMHLMKTYQREQPTRPWHTEVSPQQRTQYVMEIRSSLQLARSDQPFPQVVKSAMQLEQERWLQSPDKQTYMQSRADILQRLRNAREQQSNNMLQPGSMAPGMGMVSQAPMQAGMPGQGANNQFSQPFAPQLMQPMQATPLPGQPQTSSGMGMSTPGAPATPNQQPQQQPQNRQQPGPNQRLQLSPQDQMKITSLAQGLMKRSSQEEQQRIRANFQKLPPEQRQRLEMSQIDPVLAHYRMAAQRMLVNSKQQQNQQGQAAQQPSQGAGGMNQNQQQMQRSSSQMQNGQSQQGMGSENAGFDISQFAGQQAEGLRSQDAGQLVVPASNNGMGQQLGGMGGINLPQSGQFGQGQNMNGLNLQQQQMATMQQMQRENTLRASHMQAQEQAAAQARARQQALQQQAQSRGQLTGQVGGLNAQNPQQSPAMSLLTQPMAPPGGQTPQQRPQGNMPQMGGPSPQPGANPAAPGMQQPQQGAGGPGQMSMQDLIQNLAPQIRQQLLGLPEDKRRQALQQLIGQARQQGRFPGPGQPPNRPPQMPPNGQPMMSQGSQMGQQQNGFPGINNQNMAPQAQSGQQLPPGVMNQQALMQQQRMVQEQNRLRQQQQPGGQPGGQQPMMNPAIIREMDQKMIPPKLLNGEQKLPVPEHIKTWGQLKDWVSHNPNVPQTLAPQRLLMLQTMHYRHLLQSSQQANANGQQRFMTQPDGSGPMQQGQPNGQAPQAQMLPPSMPQNRMPPQMVGQGPGVMPQNMPQLPPPTMQQVQELRMRLQAQGQGQNLSDDQLRQLVQNHKQQAFQRHNQMRAMQQQQQQMRGQANGMGQPPNMAQAQAQAQLNAQRQREQQQQAMQNAQQNQTPRPAQTPSQAQTPVRQASQKGLKRPSSDDVVEIPNPNQQPQQAAQAPPMQPSKSQQLQQVPAGVAPEKWASLTPQQRQMFISHQQKTKQQAQQAQQAPGTTQPAGDANAANKTGAQQSERWRAMFNDVNANLPPVQQINLPQEVTSAMQNKIDGCRNFLDHLDGALTTWWKHKGPQAAEDNPAKQMIRLRLILFRAMDSEKKLKLPAVIDPQQLDQILLQIRSFVVQVWSEFRAAKQPQASQAGQVQASPKQPQPAAAQETQQNGQQQQLNKANLDQHQTAIRQQGIHRRQHSKPPAAPTDAKPPFALGAPSPSGAPQAYGSIGLTQKDLKLPPAKKRRKDTGSAPSTPAQPTPGPTASPQITKAPTPEMRRQQAPAPAEPKPTFKCPKPDCDHHLRPFETKEELDQHVQDTHMPIKDPIQWTLGQMAAALGCEVPSLDDDADKDKPSALKAPTPGAIIKAGQTPGVKQEASTPAGAVATPKDGNVKPSPSKLLKTPQQPGKPAPTSAPGKDGKVKAAGSKDGEATGVDPWANSHYSLYEMGEIFGGMEDAIGLGMYTWGDDDLHDAPDNSWALRDRSPDTTTPSSDESKDSGETDVTRPSDISENDVLTIHVDGDLKNGGAPPDENIYSEESLTTTNHALVADFAAMGALDPLDENGDVHIDMGDCGFMFQEDSFEALFQNDDYERRHWKDEEWYAAHPEQEEWRLAKNGYKGMIV